MAVMYAHNDISSQIPRRRTEPPRTASVGPERLAELATSIETLADDLAEAQRIAKLGIWRWTVATQAFAWSDEMFRIAGRDRATYKPTLESSLSCIHPDDVAGVHQRLLSTIAGGSDDAAEFRIIRPDGETRHCWAEVRPVLDEHKQVTAVRGILQDITERKAIEEKLRESEEHYRYTVELSPQIPWTADPSGRLIEVSQRGFQASDRPRDDALGHGWLEFVHPDDRERAEAAWRHSLETGETLDSEYRMRRFDGGGLWVRARAGARRNEQGEIVRWYGTLEDIDDQKRAEAALLSVEEVYRLAVRATGLAIWDYDHASGTRRWSDELRDMLGFAAEVPADTALFLERVVEEDRKVVTAVIDGDDPDPALPPNAKLFRFRRADTGAVRWLTFDIHRVRDESGTTTRSIVAIRDITESKEAQDQVTWAARHDPLTGLANRLTFQERLHQAVSTGRAPDCCAGLLLVDLDDFKLINDTLGHDAGDRLLQVSAERIRKAVGEHDTVARLGGDEFAILLAQPASDEEVLAIAERVIAQLGIPFRLEDQSIEVRASIGATTSRAEFDGAEAMFKHADIALYVSKAEGRGRVTMFRPEMRAVIQQRASMLSLARGALASNAIEPHYQPQVDLHSGKLVGFEALLRWRDRHRGLQLPGSVAAAFEDNELATSISDRMFERVIADMRRWLDGGLPFGRVAVNASAAEFRRDNFAERVLGLLKAGDVPASCLELEVTETVFLGRGSELVDRALNLLSSEGVRIALDDFGTGYASLSHLKRFPVDIIKIDRSFVRDIEEDPEDAAIVNALISLGKSLGLRTIAEGIESETQAVCLAAQGCSMGQGYYFGRPVAADAAAERIARWTDFSFAPGDAAPR
ncbi:EAL domain-containing protein [Sphingomonas parva]|uniref:EAL domain-containing protein n=1 Tax=Sphingomonas parva TaxID=2555898 RepID=A0A4Y8ZNQ9_9SPHN|nr:EAL domain-containing protein [Sphingomonas parva]TFI57087.1 EAL domain-containing protein [Sphingomonas parva]